MKKLVFILMLFIGSFSLTSCITEAYAETGFYDDDIEIVIRYGTPYYYDNTLVYYYYDGYYFYPYTYNNTWRFHRYARPLPPPRHHTHPYTARPPRFPHGNHHHGHIGNQPRGHNGHVTPHNPPRGNNGNGHISRPNTYPRHNGNMSRPSQPRIMNGNSSPFRGGSQMSRPMTPSRQSTPSMGRSMGSSRPSGHFGGGRR